MCPSYYEVRNLALVPVLRSSAWPRLLPTGHRREHHDRRPRKEEPPFKGGRFHAPALGLLEGLGVLEGGVVGMLSALEANDSQKDLVVCNSELGKVFRAEGPCHTPVQQGLDHLGLQHADLQAERGLLNCAALDRTVWGMPAPVESVN